jgi:hypothetical protein
VRTTASALKAGGPLSGEVGASGGARGTTALALGGPQQHPPPAELASAGAVVAVAGAAAVATA